MDFTMLSLGARGYHCLTEPKRFPRLPDGLLTLVEEIIYRSRYMLKKNNRGGVSCAIQNKTTTFVPVKKNRRR